MLQLYRACTPLTATREEQSAIARKMLADAWKEHGHALPPICTDDAGRPYLAELPHVDFNITHTAGLVMLALSLAPEGQIAPRVGIDAQHTNETSPTRVKRLAARFFAPNELEFFRVQGETVRAFATVFTRKEAFAKCRGDGLARNLRTTDTMQADFESIQRVCFTTPEAPEGYCITLCAET